VRLFVSVAVDSVPSRLNSSFFPSVFRLVKVLVHRPNWSHGSQLLDADFGRNAVRIWNLFGQERNLAVVGRKVIQLRGPFLIGETAGHSLR
jgi:hypothetical protein